MSKASERQASIVEHSVNYGTSGQPKQVLRTHDGLAAHVAVSCLAGRQAWPEHAGQPLQSGKRLAASGVLLLTCCVFLLTPGATPPEVRGGSPHAEPLES